MAANASAAAWSVSPWNFSVQTIRSRRAGRDPALDQRQQAGGIGDDVADQPVDRFGRRARRRSPATGDPRHGGDLRVERRLVDRGHLRAELASTQVQPPGEAPRSRQVSPGPGQAPSRVSASHSFR